MAKPTHPAVSLWPRAEPFTYGIFQVHPHPRLAVHNIKKLVSYAKSKGKTGFPKLSYSVWKHVACNKLQLSEELAWVLFHTCLAMCNYHMEKVKDMEERLFNAANSAEFDRLRGMQSVDLFTFVLFLYIQQINKISLRASAVSANAEWPSSHNRSSELDSGRSTPIRPCRNLDEQYHLLFITENLAELLDLLVEPDLYGINNIDAGLSEDAIDALNLIIEGTVDQCRSLNSFSELVRMPAISPATGYSKTTRTYNLRGLHSWIRSWLSPNPFSVENCIRNGRRLQWRLPYQAGIEGVPSTNAGNQHQQDTSKRQRIATNAHQVPRNGGRNGNKLVIMSMISRQIIARSSATLDGATLKIHRAHCSYLYLLSPMRSVTLDKCRKLTIVLGPIENTLQLNHCEDCLIVSACRRAVLVACRRCTLHLSISSRPILIQPPMPSGNTATSSSSAATVGTGGLSAPSQTSSAPGTPTPAGGVTQLGNEEILLAPYHTTYLRLVDHMMRVSLSTKVNYWDKPFLLGQDSNRHDQIIQTSTALSGKGRCWDLLRPEHFYPFNIPLLLPSRMEHPEPTGTNADGTDAVQRTASGLDLSAALVTDTHRFFKDADERGIKEYLAMVNTRLPIPLPMPYLIALHERAAVYQKWPQHIANARLTPEQRQVFGTLVDQRFRHWLAESGNLRQLQLLELSTGHVTSSQACNTNASQADGGGVPPKANAIPSAAYTGAERAHANPSRFSSQCHRAERARPSMASDTELVNGSYL
ncbi:TBCC domain-containing protein 1 [Fasciola hepatica]|uniref:TBCC domain-containing protein 1 n=1 Tax=Fasciola hepatica TaxID=6192 RepID=A0A4E0QUN2_FASHE|nr:TBCC domain-containing protein 1 [Fasciola hepatica]